MHRVLLIHGVNTIAGEPHWTNRLEHLWESENSSFRIATWTYGGLLLNRTSAVLTWIPFYRQLIRKRNVAALAEIEKGPANLSRKYDKLSVIAHSFGGQIVQCALESGWNFHRVILIGSAMDEGFDFYKYDHQFDEIHCFWSIADKIIPWAYYGRQGFVGPQVKHPRVFSYKDTVLGHTDWTSTQKVTELAPLWKHILEHP